MDARVRATRAASGLGATRARGWSATHVVDGGEIGAGELGITRANSSRATLRTETRLEGREQGRADARAVGGMGAHRRVVRHHRVGGGVVPRGDAGAGTPVFAPNILARTDAPNLRDSSGDGSRNASRNPPPDGEIPFDDAFGEPPADGRTRLRQPSRRRIRALIFLEQFLYETIIRMYGVSESTTCDVSWERR